MFKCPICLKKTCEKQVTTEMHTLENNKKLPIQVGKCKICGEFRISSDFIEHSIVVEKLPRHIISGVTRNLTEEKNMGLRKGWNLIKTFDDVKNALSIPTNPIEKIERLLLFFYHKQSNLSKYVSFDPDYDYPICFAEDSSESTEYIKISLDYGYLISDSREPFTTTSSHGNILITRNFKLTLEGWTKANELLLTNKDSKQAFIAMHFNTEAKDILNKAFFPALETCGYIPYSSLTDEHNESITDVIIANIRKSGLLIADLTGGRQNVYYEAGFAKGLGIPVIFTCKADSFNSDSHFDVDHIKHIKWNNLEDLKQKLINRIEATGLSKI